MADFATGRNTPRVSRISARPMLFNPGNLLDVAVRDRNGKETAFAVHEKLRFRKFIPPVTG